jgi:hypothetical protein
MAAPRWPLVICWMPSTSSLSPVFSGRIGVATVRGWVRAISRALATASSVVDVVLVSSGAAVVVDRWVVVVDRWGVIVVDAPLEVADFPENAATPPSAASTATIAAADRPFEPPTDMTTSVLTLVLASPDNSSRSGASSGLPHVRQNWPDPDCVSPQEKQERPRPTVGLYRCQERPWSRPDVCVWVHTGQ